VGKIEGRRLLAVCAAFMAVTICNVSLAGVNEFTFTGPEGGSVSGIAFKPDDPNVVIIGGPRGAYRSDDGGLTWQPADAAMQNGPLDIAFDPTNFNRVVITSGDRLFVSEDAGRTYSVLQAPAAQVYISKIRFASNGRLYALSFQGNVYSAVAPFNSWSPPARPLPGNDRGTALAVDPQDPTVLFVAIEGYGIFRSNDGGATWSAPLTTGMPSPAAILVNAISVKPGDSNVVLASTNDGLYRSNNSGASWTWQGLGIVYWAEFDPHTPGFISAGGTFGNIMRSEDDGATWSLGADVKVVGGNAAFDPATPGRILATSTNGVIETLDYGATFTFRNTGLRGGGPQELTVSDDGTVYLAMPAGLDVLFMRGTNYTPVGTAQLRGFANGTVTITALAASPMNSSRLYAVNNGNQLMRSADGGANWTAPHPAFSGIDYINGVAFHPGNPDVAYVGRSTTGLWRTTNNGATWDPLPDSPPYVRAIAFDPADNDVMYISAGTAVTGANGIFKSVDGGETWDELIAPGSNSWIYGFTFDPENSSTVYAIGTGGLLKSINGGASWDLVNFGGNHGVNVNSWGMYIDAARPSTMVVVGLNGGTGFLRTVDGGATWQVTLLGGPYSITAPAVLLTDMVVRPQEPNLLIMAAQNGGVLEYEIAPDLELSMNGPDDAIALGSVTPLQLTVRNLGIHDASAAEVRITLPAWLTPSTPAGCTYSAPTLTCGVSYIRSEQSRVIDFQVTASMTPSSGQVSATVTGHERDPVSTNDVASVALQSLEIADLVTSFGNSALAFDNRGEVALAMTVTNAGPNPSTNTQVVVELGPRLTGVTVTPEQGTCALAGTTATCDIGTVVVGGDGVRIDITATADGIGATAVTALAQGEGVDTGTDQGATANLTLRAVSDIGVAVADSADPVTTGTNWTYTATVTNAGPDPGDATLSVTFEGATPSQASGAGAICSFSGAVVTCELEDMANGASVAVAIVASSSTAGNATANAIVIFDGTDSANANNTASASTTKVAPPPPPSSGGGKKGGGGALDVWLLLGLLSLQSLAIARRMKVSARILT
jgi:hypothetical protein